MTKKPHRTHALDRDGDGKPGGSLPGNQTAPMATDPGDPNRPDDGPPNAEQAPPEQPPVETSTDATTDTTTDAASDPATPAIDDLANARATPGDGPEKLEGIERDVDEANADAPAPAGDDAPDATADVEIVIAEQALLDQEDAADLSDTFTPEEIAAGQTPVVDAEGEDATATAADTAVTLDADDPLVTVQTETAPIAVRLRELQILIDARRLYKSPEGYSSNYGAPYIDHTTVQAWIAAGLAEDVPSAGTWGGVRVTAEARSVATRIRLDEAA